MNSSLLVLLTRAHHPLRSALGGAVRRRVRSTCMHLDGGSQVSHAQHRVFSSSPARGQVLSAANPSAATQPDITRGAGESGARQPGGTWRELRVKEDDAAQRLDRYLRAAFPALPLSRIHSAVRKNSVILKRGDVRVKAAASTRLECGDSVSIKYEERQAPAPRRRRFTPSATHLRALASTVIFEDDDIVALNKPSGLPVQAGGGGADMMDVVLGLPHLSVRCGVEKLRLVHRLDKDTSGVLLIAKNRSAAVKLGEYFRNKAKLKKRYLAVLNGTPHPATGRIKSRIVLERRSGSVRGRLVDEDSPGHNAHRRGMGGDEEGKVALTEYRRIDHVGDVSVVELVPETGRTHQLRIHCGDALKCPIIGDVKYGVGVPDGLRWGVIYRSDKFVQAMLGKKVPLMLHAHSITLPALSNPKRSLTVTAPLPLHFQHALSALDLSAALPPVNEDA